MNAPQPQPFVADAAVVPPVIIKKITVAAHAEHHGGAWKVAYADFVTAMMAFFLLMWLVGATNEDQRKGIADYFSPTLVRHSKAGGSNGVMGGRAPLVPDGNAAYATPRGSQRIAALLQQAPEQPEPGRGASKPPSAVSQSAQKLKEDVHKRLREDKALAGLSDQVRVTVTDEGLRIEILDRADFAMFKLGTSELSPRALRLTRVLAQPLAAASNRIAVRGHTDSLPYTRGQRNNWQLSAERAEAMRQALVASGVNQQRFQRLEGAADMEPYNPRNHYDPRNRRVSITLLTRRPA